MLTILHRRADGSERLFEAESFERAQPDGVDCVPACGHFVAHGVQGNLGGTCEIRIEWPFGAVFVMNEAGSTVARYMASQPLAEAA